MGVGTEIERVNSVSEQYPWRNSEIEMLSYQVVIILEETSYNSRRNIEIYSTMIRFQSGRRKQNTHPVFSLHRILRLQWMNGFGCGSKIRRRPQQPDC